MRKLLILSVIVATITAGSTLAISRYVSRPVPPQGVPAEDTWRPISNNLGFVIRVEGEQIVRATLMARVGSTWVPAPVAAVPPHYLERILPAR